MQSKYGKYICYQKDDLYSFSFRIPLMKRKKEYFKTFNTDFKLRNRSTINKTKSNENFDLRHTILCLDVCTKGCKMENYKKRKIPSSIEGLNCDKINDNLYASQRLSNQLIKEYDLINKLKSLNIGLLINCEEEGEHPCCGTPYNDGLDQNGFAYSTVELENNNIHTYKCGWTDFIAPNSFNHMIKIVKKMYYYIHILNKNILVHCHAGFGRTAISLVCYLIFEKKLDAENARKEIRKGERKMCLGGGVQYNYCQQFAEYLKILRENFFEKNKKDIEIFKISEKLLDIGNYKFTYFNDNNYKDYVPIFLLYIFDAIIQIKNEKKLDDKTINNLLTNKDINTEDKIIIDNLKKEINNNNWEQINQCKDLKILGYLLFNWLEKSIKYVVNPKEISSINEMNNSLNFEKLKDSTKKIIQCIGKFISFIKPNDEKNDNNKEFMERFTPLLLGYSNALNESFDKDMKKNIEILTELINGNFK